MEGQTHPISKDPSHKDGCPKNPQSKIGLLLSIRGHVHLIIADLGL